MKVVIIGGVAGGASAAARLRRMDENAENYLYKRPPRSGRGSKLMRGLVVK